MDDDFQLPIYAALVCELADPAADWDISPPPEFADELIHTAFTGPDTRAPKRKTANKSRKRSGKKRARTP